MLVAAIVVGGTYLASMALIGLGALLLARSTGFRCYLFGEA
jgi:hypothetical protein